MPMVITRWKNLQQMGAPKRFVFLEQPNTISHNILLLTQYYTRKQHQHFTAKLQTNFNKEQMRDTWYIPPPRIIPLCHILTNECNP